VYVVKKHFECYINAKNTEKLKLENKNNSLKNKLILKIMAENTDSTSNSDQPPTPSVTDSEN
jgi:hypothetical protein